MSDLDSFRVTETEIVPGSPESALGSHKAHFYLTVNTLDYGRSKAEAWEKAKNRMALEVHRLSVVAESFEGLAVPRPLPAPPRTLAEVRENPRVGDVVVFTGGRLSFLVVSSGNNTVSFRRRDPEVLFTNRTVSRPIWQDLCSLACGVGAPEDPAVPPT